MKCFNLREELLGERIEVDLILCSPLLRALRTCRHVFDPLKVKKIVVPELTEVLRYACDINDDI
jgi:phosphohistidine phosphatase SixA